MIMVREVSGQVAILPLPSKAKEVMRLLCKAKEVMVKSSCKHCMAVHSKSNLKLTKRFDQIMEVVDSEKFKTALKQAKISNPGMLLVV